MKIGLTQRVVLYSEKSGITGDFTDHGWYDTPLTKGHTLIPVPNRKDLDYDGLAEELDLLIITGGMNEDIRVITETEIATSMVSMGKPVLGICHGAFLLTHILRGQVDGDKEQHFFSNHTNYYETQGREVEVNSSHTVFIKEKPPGAQVLCTDPEGDCESWIKDNICAIVWHPERMDVPFVPDEILEATGLTL
jgi:GMP synthase-like glutamine amidotransferase